MARSVDHIDLHTFIHYRHILCENGDASFPFEVIVVKDKLSQLLLFALLARLIDHPVHESGLSMVNMGDDRYVSDFLHSLPIINPVRHVSASHADTIIYDRFSRSKKICKIR